MKKWGRSRYLKSLKNSVVREFPERDTNLFGLGLLVSF
jgi:hypothetical protein